MAAAFTQDDLALLEKTISARKTLLDGIDLQNIKGDVVKMSSAVALLDSIDKTIVNVAKVRVDETGVKNAAEIQQRSAEFLMQIHQRLNKKNHAKAAKEVPSEIKAKDVPGIKHIGQDTVSMDNFA
jgi:poly-D-alanine transfer protein DltD